MISYLKKFTEEIILAIVPPGYHATFVTRSYLNIYGPNTPFHDLFPWEDKVIQNFFPPPPCRILVGGAGSGREMIALSKKGYYLSGFEPILISANKVRTIIPKEKLLAFYTAKYEDLVNGALKEIEYYSPYDAVILGWGSISHILDPIMHKLILKKVRSLCPNGPVLLSWRKYPDLRPKVKLLRNVFSFLKLRSYPESDYFRFDLGFCHGFNSEEIKKLASATNNLTALYEDKKNYPHAVLVANNETITKKSTKQTLQSYAADSLPLCPSSLSE